MVPTFEERLDAIAWEDFGTAYGAAVKVPDQLRRLAGSDRTACLEATHELWSGLCHQHVQIGSAALPVLPFLLATLDTADTEIAVELLDILLGFAIGVNRRRRIDFLRSLGRTEDLSEQPWISDLRAAMLEELPLLLGLADSSDGQVADFAIRIVAELAEGRPPGPSLEQSC